MLMLDRRTLLRAGSAVVAVGAAALAPTAPALARAPQVGKQAQPGFYRFKLGTIDITVVSDGTLAFPAETRRGDRAEDARGLLTSTFQPSSPVGLERCGATGPRTQEACSHPRSSRLARWGWKSTLSLLTRATSWC
jgi:hypothetical protein